MVGIIHRVASIEGMLRYNEQKIDAGVAQCIGQGNFPISHNRLSFTMKLNMLKRNVALRPRKKPAIHIFLSFSPAEKIVNKKMVKIAETYMDRIGFGKQPFLIYRHFDTAHPHLHICTVEVNSKGELLSAYEARRFLSRKVTRDLEKEFGLVAVNGSRVQFANPRQARRVIHGEQPVTHAIENVLAKVLSSYRYTNLSELNALLELYNIRANRGLPGSWLFKNRGLYYQVLSNDGKPISKPVKSSCLIGKPTLALLERNFFINHPRREKGKQQLLTSLNKTLFSKPQDLEEFRYRLSSKGVDTVFQKQEQGKTALIYIDHLSRCVFKGSDLGPEYTVLELQRKWGVQQNKYKQITQSQKVAEKSKTYTATLKVVRDYEEKDRNPVRYSQLNQGDIGVKNSTGLRL